MPNQAHQAHPFAAHPFAGAENRREVAHLPRPASAPQFEFDSEKKPTKKKPSAIGAI
jgi:hypothetical protein